MKWKTAKLLMVMIKKYEKVFLKLLEDCNKNMFNIWSESDFINIYDKDELSFEDIKQRLDFTFLDDYWYRRTGHTNFSFQSENSVLDIYHSDYECSKCHWPRFYFNNFPDYNKRFDSKYFEVPRWKESVHLFTNINDYESITIWWNQKINEILSNKELIDKYDLISLNKTCISVIMWDDIKSIFEYNKINPKKIFYTDQHTDSPYRAVINYLKNIEINNNFKWKTDEKVIFFWLNKNKNTYEIVKLLRDNFWIDVDKILIPNIKIDDIKDIMKYKLWVFFTGRETKAQNIFKLYPFLQYESPVPYWLIMTKNLIFNITNSL